MTETTTATPKHPTWQAALSAAQAEVESPGKDGHNKFHKYDYTTAESMLGASKGPLGNHGLSARLGDFETQYEKVNGEVWPVKATFWLDWEGGESVSSTFTYPAIEGKGRPADKAIAGALTTMTGYYLRGLLNIPRGLDGGISGRDDTAYQGRSQSDRRPPQRQQQRPSKPQDKPLQSALEDLKDALRDAFGPSDTKQGFQRAEELARQTLNKGIADVFDDNDNAGAKQMLRALEG